MNICGWNRSLFCYMSASPAGLFLVGGLPVSYEFWVTVWTYQPPPGAGTWAVPLHPYCVPNELTLDEITPLEHQIPTLSTGSSSGKGFNFFREYFSFSLFGGNGGKYSLLPADLQWWVVGGGEKKVTGRTISVLDTELQLRLWFLSCFPFWFTSRADNKKTDLYQLRLSHLQVMFVGLNNKEFIILHNKKFRSSAVPAYVSVAAQQHQQVADYFHLFSDNLSTSSQLSS